VYIQKHQLGMVLIMSDAFFWYFDNDRVYHLLFSKVTWSWSHYNLLSIHCNYLLPVHEYLKKFLTAGWINQLVD